MTITYEIFAIFASLCILSAIMTIIASNPVHSVFFLIFAFVNASGLFFLLGVEFLAVIFIIVYVGAVAILFLFVVMMLNINLVESTESSTRFLPLTIIIGLVFLFQTSFLLENFSNTDLLSANLSRGLDYQDWTGNFINFSNIQMLGQYLYTDYASLLLLSSMILLVAMIGAIILSLDHHRAIRRQDLYSQINTRSTVELLK